MPEYLQNEIIKSSLGREHKRHKALGGGLCQNEKKGASTDAKNLSGTKIIELFNYDFGVTSPKSQTRSFSAVWFVIVSRDLDFTFL